MNPQLIEITHGRHNPGIDPVVHIWGWEVPVYLFLGGLTAGVMILLAALELKRGSKSTSRGAQLMPFGAIGLISAGMGALFLDLAYKLHVYRFYMSFEITSPMSWGSWLLLAVYPLLIVMGIGGLSAEYREWIRGKAAGFTKLLDLAFGIADKYRRVILWATLGIGVGLGIYTGLLLGTMSARFQWNSAVMGPLFLTSGISTGAALLLFCQLDHDEHHTLMKWDTVAITIELGLILTMLIGFITGGTADQLAGHTLLGGHWTPYFWSLVMLLGLIAPLAMNLAEIVRKQKPSPMGPLLVLIGGFALRYIMVAAGQETNFKMLLP
jgi:formate-dependent nitrite reductase membrane component NrfD